MYECSAIYLGYVLHASLSNAAHTERQVGMVYTAIGQTMAALAVTTPLRREHLLAVYRLFVLLLLEHPIEVLGAIEPALVRRLDTAQRRCLALCADRGGTFASNDTLRALLGEFETSQERRVRRCAVFSRSLLLSMER